MNKYYVFARYRLPDYMRPDNCNALWSGQEPAAHSLEEQGGKTCPWLITITLALVFCLVGCATPIGVKKVGMRKAYQEINANVLNGEGLSDETKIVLHRFDLLKRFKKDSAASIAFIHKKANQDTRRDLRFALAELCYSHGEKLQETARQDDTGRNERAADYFLMSAIYAYQYLFSTVGGAATPYDHRFRVACDLYNRALGKGLATGEDGQIEFQNGVRRLPVGRLAITLNSDLLPWQLGNFHAFLPADDYAVRGLSVRNRTAGIGLPLVALHRKTLEMPGGPALPITAFLRVSGDVSDLDNGSASATLELYSAYEGADVVIKGRNVPLETDSTTPLAYMLEDSGIWMLGLRRFITPIRQEPELLLIQPYQAGRIPVVFVHGTASSPVWWAEMWNTLRSDPVLRKRYLFWFFTYNSSVPITISAAALREALSEMVANLDPEGKDPALQQMVVVGHSQGGLLAKLSVVNTGSTLWWTFTDHSLEDLKAEPELKARLREYFFIEPLHFVTRVVYISTPHRGSFLAKSWVRKLVRRFVTLPHDILTGDSKIYGNLFEQSKLPSEFRDKIPTSIDSMSPQNPLLMALSEMPVAPGVKAHSIIAVKGVKDPATGNDGVVKYTSAHQKGVQSEFVVRAGHSHLGHPLTIEEVRRILLSHLASLPGSPGLAGQRE
jgi:triacylglycerol esterase/lipase EstA (alpha/beta hydrolase family)